MVRTLLILTAITLSVSQAETVTENPWCDGCPIEKAGYERIVQSFIDQVKNKQQHNVAARIHYPLRRNNSVYSIINEQDLLNKFSAVFDEHLSSEIAESKPFENWKVVGYKGIMLNRGTVWMNFDGKVIAINYTSPREIEYQERAWASAPVYVVETEKYLIRISKPDNGTFCYTAWPLGASPVSKPDIVLNDGAYITYDEEGTHSYHFKNGNYEYSLSTTPNPEDGRFEGTLRVKKGEKLLLEQTILTYRDSMRALDWVDLFFRDSLSNLYGQSTYISPSRYQADFNGDQETDVAVAAVQKSSGKKGIIILHKGSNHYYVLGAGTEIGNGGDDFGWMDTWNVETNPTALYVGKMESAGGTIYWTGKEYRWRQSGD